MDIESALVFSAHMIVAYCFVLWIQYSAWKEFKIHKQNVDKTLLDIAAEISCIKKSINSTTAEPKKILVDQKSLYSLK